MKKTAISLTILATALFAFRLSAQNGSLVFAAGFVGGTYYQVASTMSDLPGMSMKVLETAGTQENIELVKSGKADLGFVQLDVLETALSADAAVKSNVKIILPVYSEEVHIVTTAEMSLPDLNGKRISIGPAGSGTQSTAKLLMELESITPGSTDESSSREGLQKLVAGQVDALIVVAGAPLRLLKESTANLFLVSMKSSQISKFTQKKYGYKKSKIPAGTYTWLKNPVMTVSVESMIVCKAATPDWQVENIIEKVVTNHVELFLSHEKWKELDSRNIAKLMKKQRGLFHPAAVKILKTKKI